MFQNRLSDQFRQIAMLKNRSDKNDPSAMLNFPYISLQGGQTPRPPPLARMPKMGYKSFLTFLLQRVNAVLAQAGYPFRQLILSNNES
jgi:hypothetical protein